MELRAAVCVARHAANAPLSHGATANPALGALTPLDEAPTLQAAPSPMVPLTAAPAELPPLHGRGLLTRDAFPSGVQPYVRQLCEYSAESFELSAWGAESQLQRFSCCAPVPGPAGFVRHFDAIAPTAEQAAEKVCRDIQSWRAQLAVTASR